MSTFFKKINIQLFKEQTEGVIGIEAIIALPVLTLLVVGILEFGSIFWQREQIETGLRDAARYMARCRHEEDVCRNIARNLAYHGSTATTQMTRVPQWNSANSPINFSSTTSGSQINISATTEHELANSPIFGFLGINAISVTASHQQRVIGW